MCHSRVTMVTPTRTTSSTSMSYGQKSRKYQHYHQHQQTYSSPASSGKPSPHPSHAGSPSVRSSSRTPPASDQRPKPLCLSRSKHASGSASPKKITAARTHSSPMASTPRGAGSPQGCYPHQGSPQQGSSFAASKCFEPPTPSTLPKPPVTWCAPSTPPSFPQFDSDELSNHLKLLLKVQA